MSEAGIPTAGETERVSYSLLVNGVVHEVTHAWYFETLLDVLRNRLHLTGTKVGCSDGQCGACTVTSNGVPILACLELGVEAADSEIRTIEGINPEDGSLTRLQEALLANGDIQCGFCMPGIVMAAEAWLHAHPNATEEQIREDFAGNLCRCSGYTGIIAALQAASRTES
ncbi:MAG: (2Fe-2S)-binding protein [Synechococcus sp.]|nr:(2Fe-2S)-binding protein [Synechococcus sp.]